MNDLIMLSLSSDLILLSSPEEKDGAALQTQAS